MIHSLFDSQDQNKNYSNIQYQKYPKENLVNMKKGVMVNGSEVFYGKGKKVDVKYNKNKFNGNPHNSHKINITNSTNQIQKYEQITYTVKEEKKIIKTVNHGKPTEIQKNEKVSEEKEMEFKIDDTQPRCFVSIRLYKGDIIKAEFNSSQKFGDVYALVKKISRNNNFILLEGFPPRPLIEYGKTIKELGLENSMLTQRIN
jgi:hypothetical protein